MARKSTRKRDVEQALMDAAMELAAERDWDAISLRDIAEHAGVSLAQARAHACCRGDILRRLEQRLDEALLESLEKEPPQGEAIDRLFDIIMRRLELLAPYRAAVRRLLNQPLTLLADCPLLLPGALASRQWMLAAAGVEKPGLEGKARLCGLQWVYLKALRAWVNDDDPGLSRTMATLDKALRRGEAWLKRGEAPLRALDGLRRLTQQTLCTLAGLATGGEQGGAKTSEPPRQDEPAAKES